VCFANIRQGANVITLFCPLFTYFHTNLECLLDYAGIPNQEQTLADYKNSKITDKIFFTTLGPGWKYLHETSTLAYYRQS
jgi:hypothetical protein